MKCLSCVLEVTQTHIHTMAGKPAGAVTLDPFVSCVQSLEALLLNARWRPLSSSIDSSLAAEERRARPDATFWLEQEGD